MSADLSVYRPEPGDQPRVRLHCRGGQRCRLPALRLAWHLIWLAEKSNIEANCEAHDLLVPNDRLHIKMSNSPMMLKSGQMFTIFNIVFTFYFQFPF